MLTVYYMEIVVMIIQNYANNSLTPYEETPTYCITYCWVQ